MGLMPPTTPRIKLIILSELAAGVTWIKPSSSTQNFCWAMEVLFSFASCAGTLTGFLTSSTACHNIIALHYSDLELKVPS